MLGFNNAFCDDINTLYHYWKHHVWDFLFAFSAVTLVNHSHPVVTPAFLPSVILSGWAARLQQIWTLLTLIYGMVFHLISFFSFLYIHLGYLFTTIQYIFSLINYELSLSFLINC